MWLSAKDYKVIKLVLSLSPNTKRYVERTNELLCLQG